jgi:glycogen operon protein
MADADWGDGDGCWLGVLLDGSAIPERDRRGQPIVDDRLMVLFDLGDHEVSWKLPDLDAGRVWTVLLDTGGDPTGAAPTEEEALVETGSFTTDGRRVVLLAARDVPAPA